MEWRRVPSLPGTLLPPHAAELLICIPLPVQLDLTCPLPRLAILAAESCWKLAGPGAHCVPPPGPPESRERGRPLPPQRQHQLRVCRAQYKIKFRGPLFKHDDSVLDSDRGAVSHSAFRAGGDAAWSDCPAPCPGDPVGGFLLNYKEGPTGLVLKGRGGACPGRALSDPPQRTCRVTPRPRPRRSSEDGVTIPVGESGVSSPPPACVAPLVGRAPEAAHELCIDRSEVCGVSTSGAFTGGATPPVRFRTCPHRRRTAAPGPHGSASCPGSAASGLSCKWNPTARLHIFTPNQTTEVRQAKTVNPGPAPPLWDSSLLIRRFLGQLPGKPADSPLLCFPLYGRGSSLWGQSHVPLLFLISEWAAVCGGSPPSPGERRTKSRRAASGGSPGRGERGS
ncbi:uncharacterized protein LOC116595831 [Mustela erminea]|uniref:uncharacterized protein LOC116595831 n=1 Tax=Mustela erminea TaxID=36723 RepID=UPI001386D56B|nr:uncharacterized protein LOC116595831 [Mustela erminea]